MLHLQPPPLLEMFKAWPLCHVSLRHLHPAGLEAQHDVNLVTMATREQSAGATDPHHHDESLVTAVTGGCHATAVQRAVAVAAM
jgi:hypothetical protein